MIQSMRWFGPADPIALSHIRQAGATEVVTALHEIPNGVVWPRAAIAERRAMIEAAGLGWSTVESLPVHDAIKRGELTDELIQAYGDSLRNLAAEGVRTVTYNFMPLLDWTRTDLDWRLPDGATALRFEWAAVAAYDIHILRRPGAEADYSEAVRAAAAERFAAMTPEERHKLERTIIAGLPGSEESFDSPAFQRAIDTYAGIDADALRANHIAFLRAVCPIAEEVGITLVVHPDDPLPDLRSAARRQHGGRPRSSLYRGTVAGERPLLLHRIVRGAAGQRSACDGAAFCRADRLPPPPLGRLGAG